MCRHLLPRFELPAGQVMHAVGRLIVAHPAAVAALVIAPTLALVVVLACRRFVRPRATFAVARRTEPGGRRALAFGRGVGAARAG